MTFWRILTGTKIFFPDQQLIDSNRSERRGSCLKRSPFFYSIRPGERDGPFTPGTVSLFQVVLCFFEFVKDFQGIPGIVQDGLYEIVGVVPHADQGGYSGREVDAF